MRALIQRVSHAQVEMKDTEPRRIGQGLVVFLGVEEADSEEDVVYLCRKVLQLRVFGDAEGNMNLSLQDLHGELLLISQFTLHASTKKGNRPSFIKAAKPDLAQPLYNVCAEMFREQLGHRIQTGEFGAQMEVNLCNSGPVTIFIDTKNKE